MNLIFLKKFSAGGTDDWNQSSAVSFSGDGRILAHSRINRRDASALAQSGFVHSPTIITDIYRYDSELTVAMSLPQVVTDIQWMPYHFFLEQELIRCEKATLPTEEGQPVGGMLRAYDGMTGTPQRVLSGAFFTDSATKLATDSRRFFCFFNNQSCPPSWVLYDRANDRMIPLEGKEGEPWEPAFFAFSSDSCYLRGFGANYPYHNKVFVWETQTGTLVYCQLLPYLGTGYGLNVMDWSNDLRLFLVGHLEGTYHNKKQIDFIRLVEQENHFGFEKSRLFVKDIGGICLLDGTDYYLLQKEDFPWGIYHCKDHRLRCSVDLSGTLYDAALSEDGRYLAALTETIGGESPLLSFFSMENGAELSRNALPTEKPFGGYRAPRLLLHPSNQTILVQYHGEQYLYRYNFEKEIAIGESIAFRAPM